MSRALDSRARLLAAFEAGGIASTTSGTFSAPCVLVEPGDPWSEPVRLPGRTYRWRLTAIAGRTDSDASLEVLAELVDQVDAAIRTLRGVSLPAWSRPTDSQLGNLPYATAVGTIVDSIIE